MKNFLAPVLVFVSLVSCYSQSTLGFAAGGNYSIVPYTTYFDVADVDSKFSYTAATCFTAPLSKNLSYSVGLYYNRLNAHLIAHDGSPSHSRIEDFEVSLGFISLHAMPQYNFGRNKSFYIKAGGYFSILAKSSEIGTYEVRVINGDHHQGKIDRDARNDYEDIDFGLAFNTGVRLKFDDISWFVIQAGYNLGLYKYNQVGSNITNVHPAGFKAAYFMLGFDIKTGHKQNDK